MFVVMRSAEDKMCPINKYGAYFVDFRLLPKEKDDIIVNAFTYFLGANQLHYNYLPIIYQWLNNGTPTFSSQCLYRYPNHYLQLECL
uniref:Uncharacterized protein n=1 Tax=Timema cristinae TaxID=61476 RepID=A0A7R9H4E6_TIMCR|nr:unnamed protein product [Timema cristinae]